jgi:hypothetical protein
MQELRAIFHRNRWLAFMLVVLAIGMKAVVPSGYMVGGGAKSLTFHICDGKGSQTTATIAVPVSSREDGGKGPMARHDGICPHSALSHSAMTGSDPIQLAFALLFIFAMGFAALVLRVRAHVLDLRPHLRGPPAHA